MNWMTRHLLVVEGGRVVSHVEEVFVGETVLANYLRQTCYPRYLELCVMGTDACMR